MFELKEIAADSLSDQTLKPGGVEPGSTSAINVAGMITRVKDHEAMGSAIGIRCRKTGLD